MSVVSNQLEQGLLLVDKPKGKSSFYLITLLRSICNVKKIGHTGTLDPIATGLMLLLVGKNYTTKAPLFLNAKKTYEAVIFLSESTDTYDCQGTITKTSSIVPTSNEVINTIASFQGMQSQIPPMYSAKKINGKKLYELARQNIQVERKPINVELDIELLDYEYPFLKLKVHCTSGTYIRTLAHDIGTKLKSYGHIKELRRTENGAYHVNNALSMDQIQSDDFNITHHLITL